MIHVSTPTSIRDQGFTLIELLIVIAIIAVLAAILIPTFSGAQKRPRDTAAIQCSRAILTALGPYRLETGNSPTNISQLGEDVAEVCTGQGVQVRELAGGDPGAATVGDGSRRPYMNSIIFWAWHPGSTGAYLTSPYDRILLRKTPY